MGFFDALTKALEKGSKVAPKLEPTLAELAPKLEKTPPKAAMPTGVPKMPAVKPEELVLPRREVKGGTPIAPEVASEIRITSPEPTKEGMLDTIKTFLLSAVERDPEVASAWRKTQLGEALYRGAWRKDAAEAVADLDLGNWLKPLQRDPVNQAGLLSDYMVLKDDVAQALRAGRTEIRGTPLATWQEALDKRHQDVVNDPEIRSAFENVRKGLDETFDDMVARGWITPDRYLEDYTPIRKVEAMMDGLASLSGETSEQLKSRLLSAQQARGRRVAPRETDLIDLIRRSRTEYLEKIAEHEAFLDVLATPGVNLTEQFRGVEQLPKGVAVYRPAPGEMGYNIVAEEAGALSKHLRMLDPQGKWSAGGYVLPSKVVKALRQFNRRKLVGTERQVKSLLGMSNRFLTVWNLANTNLNRVSDLLTAITLPGESGARPLGVLRMFPEATSRAYKFAFNRGNNTVTIHGQTVDLNDLVVREGLTGATITELVSGKEMPKSLERFIPEGQRAQTNPLAKVGQTLQHERMAVELAPRIAAGLDAWERTGDLSMFGKVGREVTFRYGAGSPRMSQLPIVTAMAPFVQFMGLATQRMLHTVGKNAGAAGATVLGLAAVSASVDQWNVHDENYRKIEESLPEFERNQMHVIMPNRNGDPLLDVKGKPVVIRMRMWVPEQVAGMIGLGQVAPRVRRIAEGRDTPMKFVEESGKQIQDTISGTLVFPQIVRELMGDTRPGELEKPLVERAKRVIPAARQVLDTAEEYKAHGLGEATVKLLENISGFRRAYVGQRGGRYTDADILEARSKVLKLRGKVRAAAGRGDDIQMQKYLKDYREAVVEFKRVQKAVKEQAEKNKTKSTESEKESKRRFKEAAKPRLQDILRPEEK